MIRMPATKVRGLFTEVANQRFHYPDVSNVSVYNVVPLIAHMYYTPIWNDHAGVTINIP